MERKYSNYFSFSQLHGSLRSPGMFVSDVSISLWDGAQPVVVTHLVSMSALS